MKVLLVKAALLALTKATDLRVVDNYGNTAVFNGIPSGGDLSVTRVQSQEECDKLHEDDERQYIFADNACACFILAQCRLFCPEG